MAMSQRSPQAHGRAPASRGAKSNTKQQPLPVPPRIQPTKAFCTFLFANIFSALYATIQDCDEVYNYWEPTHYLNHGYGMQTWEYSPEFAIRSWTYSGIHAIIIGLGRIFLPSHSKSAEFYFLRLVLALICALCQTRLFTTISKTFNPRVAIFFMLVMVSSSGMFHASTAYLPSSFAMYTTMLGISAFMNWEEGLHTAQGIFWFAFGGLVGWPFATALVLPFLIEELSLAFITGAVFETGYRIFDGTIRSLLILVVQIGVDTSFYKKIVCVPLNIVLYNVFSGPGKGPNIYGTEPWHFYVRNLLLNFNLWFPLALLAAPLLLLHHFVRRQQTTSQQSWLRGLVFTSPFYMWLTIFTIQPHKEERFMYPAYPALAINAAISLHIILATIGSTNPRDWVSKIPSQVKLTFVSIFILAAINMGALRILGMTTAYSAPLNVYTPLRMPGVTNPGDNICLGKEWYRFPSSYFLPNGTRAKFIKSEFKGLLPGEFSEASEGTGSYPGAWIIPSGMNDENKEDPGKYTEVSQCSFLVDSSFPDTVSTEHELNFISDKEHWEALACEKFLDVSSTSILGRLVWLPDWPMIPQQFQRRWGKYCLLRRKNQKR